MITDTKSQLQSMLTHNINTTREGKIRIATNEYIGYPHEVDEDIVVSLRRTAFADGANWQYQELINKACKYFNEVDMSYFNILEDDGNSYFNYQKFIERFKKAMEE